MPVVQHAGKKGRGVYADRAFKKGDLIEIASVIVCPNTDLSFAKMLSNTLSTYIYHWSDDEFAIAGGCGSFYNHSFNANARWACRDHTKLPGITFKAVRAIKAGEEITINYNGTPTCKKSVWFQVAE